MVRFAEWLVLESFVEGLEYEVLRERAFVETLEIISKAIRENAAEDEKDDGSPAELEDPFAQGDEDAKPVWTDEKEDEPAPPAQQPATTPSSGKKAWAFSGDQSESQAQIKNLVASVKVIKAAAIERRAKKIEEIREIKRSHDELMRSEDPLSAGSSRDPMEAIPILVDLGYMTPGEARNLEIAFDPETANNTRSMKILDRRKERLFNLLISKINEASEEKGNDPPGGGFPSPAQISDANQKMADSIYKLLGSRFYSLARSNQKILGLDKIGHKMYEPDDLANEMVLGLIRHLSERKWIGGELQPWSMNEEIFSMDSERLMPYLMLMAKRTPKKIVATATRALSPNSRRSARSQIKNAANKSALVKYDLENNNLGFYEEYMRAAKERPIGDRAKGEEVIAPKEDQDEVRIRIMKDIERIVAFTRVDADEMSLNPENVRNTLLSYLNRHLSTNRRSVTYASQLAGDDDSSTDSVLSSVDAKKLKKRGGVEADVHSLESDDEFQTKGSQMDRAYDPETPQDPTSPLLGLLKRAIDEIAAEDPGVGPAMAFALCVKFGLKCRIRASAGRAGRMVPIALKVSDNARLDIPKGTSLGGLGSDCTSTLVNIGLGFREIAERWIYMPGTEDKPSNLTPISLQLVGEYLKGNPRTNNPGAIQLLCTKLKSMARRVRNDRD